MSAGNQQTLYVTPAIIKSSPEEFTKRIVRVTGRVNSIVSDNNSLSLYLRGKDELYDSPDLLIVNMLRTQVNKSSPLKIEDEVEVEGIVIFHPHSSTPAIECKAYRVLVDNTKAN